MIKIPQRICLFCSQMDVSGLSTGAFEWCHLAFPARWLRRDLHGLGFVLCRMAHYLICKYWQYQYNLQYLEIILEYSVYLIWFEYIGFLGIILKLKIWNILSFQLDPFLQRFVWFCLAASIASIGHLVTSFEIQVGSISESPFGSQWLQACLLFNLAGDG